MVTRHAESGLTWYFERAVFPHAEERFRLAVESCGHEFVMWHDGLWAELPSLAHGQRVIFIGALGNADRLRRLPIWARGTFCDTEAFHCSSWYRHASRWLLNDRWLRTNVQELVTTRSVPNGVSDSNGFAFVRPDSPLKPFAGRVCHIPTLTLQGLDFGFYYEDIELPVIVAPKKSVLNEWRFVVVGRRVIAGSGYEPGGRTGGATPPPDAWKLAREICSLMRAPEAVYVMDLCSTEEGMRLVELNPFSGADPYECDAESVVAAVSELVLGLGE